MLVDPPSGLGDCAPDLGGVPSNLGILPLQPLGDALESLTLALFGGAFAFIRAALTLVGRLVALVGDAVSFVGDAVPLIGNQLSPRLLCFTNRECVLTPVEIGAAPIRFTPGTGLSAIDHNQP
jgi:hypothetical protein